MNPFDLFPDFEARMRFMYSVVLAVQAQLRREDELDELRWADDGGAIA